MMISAAGSVDLPARPLRQHRVTFACQPAKSTKRRARFQDPPVTTEFEAPRGRSAAAEIQVGFFPQRAQKAEDCDVACDGVEAASAERSPRTRPCDIVQQAHERGVLIGNNRRSNERSSVHAAWIDDELIWETAPDVADQPQELLQPLDNLSKSFVPHSPRRRDRDQRSLSRPRAKEDAHLTELISNKILLKYFSTSLDKAESPLEIWNSVRKCVDEITALTGTPPNIRQKPTKTAACKIPFPFVEQRDSGVELTPREPRPVSPAGRWYGLKSRSNSSSYDSGFHSDRTSASPHRPVSISTENYTQEPADGAGSGSGQKPYVSFAGETIYPASAAAYPSARRKRNARGSLGDDSSQDEAEDDAEDDRGKAPVDPERGRNKKTRLAEPDSNLSCPFRKRNPLRFNIRDHHPCAGQGFPNMAVLKRHIRTFHKREQSLHVCVRCQQGFSTPDALTGHLNVPIDEMCESRPVQPGGDPEDGITHKVENSLIERKASSKVDNWEGLWSKLFPSDEDIPEAEFEPPIELDEVYCEFRTVLPRLVYTLQAETSAALQQGIDYPPQEVFEMICDNFVEHTFAHCRKSLPRSPKRYVRPKKPPQQQPPQHKAGQGFAPTQQSGMHLQQQLPHIAPFPRSGQEPSLLSNSARGLPSPMSLNQERYSVVPDPIIRPGTAFREEPTQLMPSKTGGHSGANAMPPQSASLKPVSDDNANLMQTDSAIDLSNIDTSRSGIDEKGGSSWCEASSLYTYGNEEQIGLDDISGDFLWDLPTMIQ